jgi:hypothetical protein
MAASTDYVRLPDGSEWSYSLDGISYTALGVLNGDVDATWNYDRNEIEFHDGQKKISYRNQSMGATLTLADLNPQALADLSGGMLSKTDTAGVLFNDAPDQIIAAGWSDMKAINLTPTTAGGVAVVGSVVPTLTSVTGATAGALAAGVDYYIVEDDNSFFGWSIILDEAGAAGVVTTEIVTISFADVTPVASTTMSAGSPTFVPDTLALRGVQSSSGITIDIAVVNVDGGSYNFGFKATASDGTDEMVLAFTGVLDADLTDGAQLFTVTQTL